MGGGAIYGAMNKPSTLSAPERDTEVFTAAEFAMMVGCGAFADMRVELVRGKIVRMSPAYVAHSRRVALVTGAIYAALGKDALLLVHPMVALDDTSVLAPDIVLAVPGPLPEGQLPARAVSLAIEVADTTLSRDLGWKAQDYARAGIGQYWVMDITAEVTHVFTEPNLEGYGKRVVIRFTEPLPVPGYDASITLA